MIDGKIYVTEDTGPGVKGRWVDCFVETMSEVNSWDTGWKSVYSVTFVEWEEMVVTYN
jgi:3D (Asp-Asp-Asp) domain-containing protein